MYLYDACMVCTMQGIRTVTLRLRDEDHKRLSESKGSDTWEAFVLGRCSDDQTNRIQKLYMDATPDGQYALRILQSYRDACDERWSSGSSPVPGGEDSPLIEKLDELQNERAKELDIAIRALENMFW